MANPNLAELEMPVKEKQTYNSVRLDYKHIKSYDARAKQVALDHSDNGRCWWIEQFIKNSMNLGTRHES